MSKLPYPYRKGGLYYKTLDKIKEFFNDNAELIKQSIILPNIAYTMSMKSEHSLCNFYSHSVYGEFSHRHGEILTLKLRDGYTMEKGRYGGESSLRERPVGTNFIYFHDMNDYLLELVFDRFKSRFLKHVEAVRAFNTVSKQPGKRSYQFHYALNDNIYGYMTIKEAFHCCVMEFTSHDKSFKVERSYPTHDGLNLYSIQNLLSLFDTHGDDVLLEYLYMFTMLDRILPNKAILEEYSKMKNRNKV